MLYKMVAIDVDGTLINNNQEIPKENIETIQQLGKLGVHFVIVTGRPDQSVKEYVQLLGIQAPVLGCNGATIRDVMTNQLHVLKRIDEESLKSVYQYFKTKKVYPRYYSIDSAFTFNPHEFDETINPFADFSKRLNTLMPYTIIDSLHKITEHQVPITKVVFATNQADIVLPMQEKLKEIKNIEVYRVGTSVIDIVAKGVSKGEALLQYARTLNINKEEIIAIGDSENDLSMLQAVGFPVTLENGEEELKKIARLVTVSNNEAGVAKALKEIFGYNKEDGEYYGV